MLASMRHLVAHGNLSSTKEMEWGLKDLHSTAPILLQNFSDQL